MRNGHGENGYCAITDEEITQAEKFTGHEQQFLKWGHKDGQPDWNRAKNAYHIKYLAEQMMRFGWVGKPAKVSVSKERYGQVLDGNHRIRAAEYLRRVKKYSVIARIEFIDEQD